MRKARTWYNAGRWFDAHPELELHDSNGELITVPGDGLQRHIFDFSKEAGQKAWVKAMVDVVASGFRGDSGIGVPIWLRTAAP